MIPLFLAQATNAPAAAAAASGQDLLFKGLALTNAALLYAFAAVVIYLGMLLAGRLIKRRFQIPLGWLYQVFSFSMALFIPSLLVSNREFDDVETHIRAAVIITGAFVSISMIRHYLLDVVPTRRDSNLKAPKFMTQVLSICVFLVATGIVIRYIYHGDVSGLLTGAGVAGIVLGLAAQETLSNIFSGFAIYFGGQFKAGDWLQIGEHHAEIMEVNWRSTRLRTTDDVYLDIPNSSITKETLVNYTHPTSRHAMRLEIGLDYGTPPTKVKQVLLEATLMAEHVVKDRPPVVYLKDFAASSITYQIKFWMDDHSKLTETMSTIRTNLWYALRRHNISIPYPIQMETHFELPAKAGDQRQIIRQALSKVFFHRCLNEAEIEQLAGCATTAEYGRGERLIRQGEEGSSMFIVTEGRADVIVEINGVPSSVAQIGAGDCLGEMSLLTGERRSATIIALADMQVVELNKETLAPIIAQSPDLLEQLSDVLAQRRLQNEGLAAAQALSATQLAERQKDYRSNFLGKLQSFFKI